MTHGQTVRVERSEYQVRCSDSNSGRVGVGPCGLMDKASASGAGDCGFESHQGRFFNFTINFFF